MKKIVIILIALITICVSLCAVSAQEISFSINSDSDGVFFDNGKLNIEGLEFNIPDTYTQDTEKTQTGVEANLTGLDGGKQSLARFTNSQGDEIIVKVAYSYDTEINSYTPEGDYTNKTIAGKTGFLQTFEGDNTPYFTYIEDGKLIQIFAPDEQTIESIIK